ncbi:MAG: hypothetical protein ABL989_15570 [Gammaproteobacteria bacterium]
MKKLTAIAGLAVLGALASTGAHAYSATATVTFTWGGADPTGNQKGWTSSGANTLGTLTDATYFTTVPGNNSTSYFDADFATASDYNAGTADDCFTPEDDGIAPPDPPGTDYDTITLRRYGCRISDVANGYNSPLFKLTPVEGSGPAAAASGDIVITDTTITGTLTVDATTDEAGGGTGFNFRSADGSPFGNVWYGVSTSATITLNLTGTFTGTTWNITGGTARLEDPSFACQQGGFGGVAPGFILCNPSVVSGGFQSNGAGLSWGWDVDGSGTGTVMGEIPVYDTAGTTLLETISGVLAALTLDGGGNITTVTGEYRSGLGNTGGGCPTSIRWSGSAISCGTLQAGPLVVTGTAVPDPVDLTPDPFAFTDVTDVALSTVTTSNTVTITGIAAAAPITVTGGEYSIGCNGTFVSTAGTINDGQTVCVRNTSSATPATAVNTVLSVSSVSDTFTTTTIPPDTIPTAFAFTDVTGVAENAVQTSNAITVGGINAPAAISVTGGEYSIGCNGTFTAVAGNISNAETVCVRHTSGVGLGVSVNTVLTIGTVSDTFTSTTAGGDTNPDQFQFVDQDGVDQDIEIISEPVTITGIDAPAAITVTGGEYSIGCNGTFTAAAGTISNDEDVCVRHTSASTSGTAVTTTLTVGTAPASKSDAFSSGTRRNGGSSSADGLMIGLLGLVAALAGRGARRRRIAG